MVLNGVRVNVVYSLVMLTRSIDRSFTVTNYYVCACKNMVVINHYEYAPRTGGDRIKGRILVPHRSIKAVM